MYYKIASAKCLPFRWRLDVLISRGVNYAENDKITVDCDGVTMGVIVNFVYHFPQ